MNVAMNLRLFGFVIEGDKILTVVSPTENTEDSVRVHCPAVHANILRHAALHDISPQAEIDMLNNFIDILDENPNVVRYDDYQTAPRLENTIAQATGLWVDLPGLQNLNGGEAWTSPLTDSI